MLFRKHIVLSILILLLNACAHLESYDIEQEYKVFDEKKSAKILYETYSNFIKNKTFFLSPKLPGKKDKIKYYYYKNHIFYDMQKDHTYSFKNENEISEKRAKKLQKKLGESDYIYKVIYRNNHPIYSISKNEKLFFDKKGRIVAVIYSSSKDNIRYIHYDSNGEYNIDCNGTSKNCQLYYLWYKQPYIAEKKLNPNAPSQKNRKSLHMFRGVDNTTYYIVCDNRDRICKMQ